MEKKDIMAMETVLPKDFDGTFRFTNWTNEDFIGRWDGKNYLFRAGTTSPIIMPNQTPVEIQNIRKKFAKDLATREYERGADFARLLKQEKNDDGSPRLNSMHMAGTYPLEALTPYIQKCLEPLPVSQAQVSFAETTPLEDKLSRNEEGELNTVAIDKKVSLRKKALES